MADSLAKGESTVEDAGAVEHAENGPGASATTTQDAPVAQPQPQMPLASPRLDVGADASSGAQRTKDEAPGRTS